MRQYDGEQAGELPALQLLGIIACLAISIIPTQTAFTIIPCCGKQTGSSWLLKGMRVPLHLRGTYRASSRSLKDSVNTCCCKLRVVSILLSSGRENPET